MTNACSLMLFAIASVFDTEVLIWLLGVPILLGIILLFVYQVRQNRQLTDEVAQLGKMKRHNIEFELVLKAMKLSTWRVDVPSGTVTFESDYRDRLDDYTPPPGTPVQTICDQLVPDDAKRIAKGMADLMAGRIDEYHEQYQVRIPHSDRTYWGESFATIDKRDIEGHPQTIVGTTMRIDEQKQIERALVEARNQAEESDRLKSAFLANISHEVRTPLNAIVGFSDILPLARSDEERQQLVDLIKQNNAHLLRLFDDMVNMSKLEAGSSESLVKTDFDLNLLLREVADKHDATRTNPNVVIEVQAAEQAYSVVSDRNRLYEILNQYVNNAVKFTAEGSVTLGYDIADDNVRIWVRDTGKGIPADKCNERLFERFVKVDEFIPGTGLGLSICRSLAISIGGHVGVASELGHGSTFWVDLPLSA
ncbi:MAG: hypothetical protein IJ710_08825 [Prevotella sp.]|nr:hypothetical protein [Prevotella sp.]